MIDAALVFDYKKVDVGFRKAFSVEIQHLVIGKDDRCKIPVSGCRSQF